MSKRIVLTGGGTAGHAIPNIALLPALREAGFSDIRYIGSINGIEKELAETAGLPYYGIHSGKLRRYFAWKNFTDPFKILAGFSQARRILKKVKPDIIFSKGGFVCVPVIYAAASLKIPVVIHESDYTPGLANKLAMKKAQAICTTFVETLQYLPADKAVHTGSPIRPGMLNGDATAGRSFINPVSEHPLLLVTGGSLGSSSVNALIRHHLPLLLEQFEVVHLCGKGHLDPALTEANGYHQFEYLDTQMPDVMAAADFVISRAGSNTICELLALHKPHLLIPLSKKASRGDQLLNAASFRKQGYSLVLDEDEMTDADFPAAIQQLQAEKDQFVAAMEASPTGNGIDGIIKQLKKFS
ncbi:MAG: undecaprenyldiphospho-muramoylpentapeptide beta-N-acetylglucosaminyltransferase [Lachnospiraceae bacterium]|nr:undecaprenyldiphospho-muramoylpentapeptide beta-N-acetylglucosaminyltransferase [Lachnospiraceae bacterium]MDY5742335.1 undecaprenyldiphospho-muramoylpentapeptide beta-N-acetylglucosaminyltransferase [Lachnospiraceae bacterium]